MNWNLHHYYSNRTDGLMGQLLLSDKETADLKDLRQRVRERTRDIFAEAKNLVKHSKKTQALHLYVKKCLQLNSSIFLIPIRLNLLG